MFFSAELLAGHVAEGEPQHQRYQGVGTVLKFNLHTKKIYTLLINIKKVNSKDFKVLVALQSGFNDSTQKAGSDKISALQLIFDSHISPQKYRSGHLYPFYIHTKYRPIGGRLKIILTNQKPSRDFRHYYLQNLKEFFLWISLLIIIKDTLFCK